ncbi:hypothetical protein [Catenovulum adriaticum]|uniref:Ion channel n=1 Tax=Catenovulum adriaticum TaxID=2984846 RepID=A0ABY7AMN6_9ALTE|nr:hypothetical protein [Catenovulum sp. TS8]WAJ69604.1 hypothetical protein OLW01_10585 [Catenovulum sp. TS8]
MVLANNAKSHANTLRVRRALYCRMKLKHLFIGTVIHLLVLIVFLFLGLGASLGLGFKDDLTLFEEVYKFFVYYGAMVITSYFPFTDTFVKLPGAIQVGYYLLNSILQSAAIIYVYKKVRRNNAI